jgi:maleate cis-trans isomerase
MTVKLGLVKPGSTAGTENVSFWKAHAPAGVEIQVAELNYRRGDQATFEEGLDLAARLATQLARQGCGLIVVSGTPPFLLRGPAFERQWRTTLSRRLRVPVVTAMASHALALQALGATTVAVASYYGKELLDAVVSYLAAFGIRALPLRGFEPTGEHESLFSTPMSAQHDIQPEQVYSYCRGGVETLGTRPDCLYINGAGWNAAPALTRLERDLATAVIWGPVAEMWLTYATLGIGNPQDDCGVLLRDLPAPPNERRVD